MSITRRNDYRGGRLTIRGNRYGYGGGIVWQLIESRPNCNALIAETAVDGDRVELETYALTEIAHEVH